MAKSRLKTYSRCVCLSWKTSGRLQAGYADAALLSVFPSFSPQHTEPSPTPLHRRFLAPTFPVLHPPLSPQSTSYAGAKFMSDLEIQIPTNFDPFKEADVNALGTGSKDYVHVRVQQRNGRKSLTTVQGLNKEFKYHKILKDFKKEFCCNGTVVQDLELGQVIQLQGDQRKNVSLFLVQAGIVKKDQIKIHGF